mmetsp:Transcript_29561/g.61663  ORF Transcript_29561/g.61663 Transcript_29561/m.61663 type:complete len:267 (-) Transcript_29561:89-889(-)
MPISSSPKHKRSSSNRMELLPPMQMQYDDIDPHSSSPNGFRTYRSKRGSTPFRTIARGRMHFAGTRSNDARNDVHSSDVFFFSRAFGCRRMRRSRRPPIRRRKRRALGEFGVGVCARIPCRGDVVRPRMPPSPCWRWRERSARASWMVGCIGVCRRRRRRFPNLPFRDERARPRISCCVPPPTFGSYHFRPPRCFPIWAHCLEIQYTPYPPPASPPSVPSYAPTDTPTSPSPSPSVATTRCPSPPRGSSDVPRNASATSSTVRPRR